MGIQKSVADKDTVFVLDEDFFFGQDDAAHAVSSPGNALAVELADILVTVGVVDTSLITVQPKIEGRAVLDNRLIQGRQQHVGVVVSVAQRNHQQTVLLAGVAVDYRGTMISPRLISPEHLLGERLLEVNHQVLVKLEITH